MFTKSVITLSFIPFRWLFSSVLLSSGPLLLVLAISIVIGPLMVIVFRYTSDQKAIGRAKDRLKAHLLAVRLFQDQLPVVMRAYSRILRGAGSYLRLGEWREDKINLIGATQSITMRVPDEKVRPLLVLGTDPADGCFGVLQLRRWLRDLAESVRWAASCAAPNKPLRKT